MTITKSGELASFYTVNKAPIKHLRVYFSPKQSGSGDPSPENVRPIEGWNNIQLAHSGKSLFPFRKTLIGPLSSWLNGTNMWWVKNELVDVFLKGRTVTFSAEFDTTGVMNDNNRCGVKLWSRNQDGTWGILGREGTYISKGDIGRSKITQTYTNYKENEFGATLPAGAITSKPMVELGSIMTEYEPYKGSMQTIDWSDSIGTIYGGYVDLITGELVQAWNTLDLGSLTWHTQTQGDANWFRATLPTDVYNNMWTPNVTTSLNNHPPHFLIDRFKTVSGSSIYYGTSGDNVVGQDWLATIRIRCDSYEQDINAFKTAMNGIILYYELATPITHQLSSAQLQTFCGQNNIWSNADRVEVEYDLAESNDELYRRRNIILKSQPHLELSNSANSTNSSNIAHFNTDISANLQSLKVNFMPIQSGSGDPSPNNIRPIEGYNGLEVTRCGKNLLKYTSTPYNRSGLSQIVEKNENNEVISVHWSGSTTDSNWFNNINYLPNKYNVFFGNFTLSTNHPSMPIIIVRNSSGGYRNNLSMEDVSEYTINFSKSLINSADTAAWYRLECWPRNTSTKTIDGKVYPMVRFPEDEGTYETYNGTTYTINFPIAIYGGYIDLVKGKLIQTWQTIDLGILDYTYRPTLGGGCFSVYSGQVTKVSPRPKQYYNGICSHYQFVGDYHNLANVNNGVSWIYEDGIAIKDKFITEDDPEAIKAGFNGVVLAYELAIPIEYNIDPVIIKTLRGVNNIWSDANGNIEVSYWTH